MSVLHVPLAAASTERLPHRQARVPWTKVHLVVVFGECPIGFHLVAGDPQPVLIGYTLGELVAALVDAVFGASAGVCVDGRFAVHDHMSGGSFARRR